MDDVGFGRLIRAVRIRRGWRQADVAARAGVSASQVSRLECGAAGLFRLEDVRAIARVLEVRVALSPTWRGGDIDRVVNESHLGVVEAMVERIGRREDWQIVLEATFSLGTERGAIDLLGWNARSAALLIGEAKSELADPGRLAAQIDRYRRLAPAIAAERGWRPNVVGVWVAVADSTMNRSRAKRAGRYLRVSFPGDAFAVRLWLREPAGELRALSFLPAMREGQTTRTGGGVRRVRTHPSRAKCVERSRNVPSPNDGHERAGSVGGRSA